MFLLYYDGNSLREKCEKIRKAKVKHSLCQSSRKKLSLCFSSPSDAHPVTITIINDFIFLHFQFLLCAVNRNAINMKISYIY